MIKEIYTALYDVLETETELFAPELEEPKTRPGFKIFLKPRTKDLNGDVKYQKIKVLYIYYPHDRLNYTAENYNMIDRFMEISGMPIITEEGMVMHFSDEFEYEMYDDILTAEGEVEIDMFTDPESRDELMEELKLLMVPNEELTNK